MKVFFKNYFTTSFIVFPKQSKAIIKQFDEKICVINFYNNYYTKITN